MAKRSVLSERPSYNKINEMHLFEFYSDNNLYMFRVGKLFIFKGRVPSRSWQQLVYMNA